LRTHRYIIRTESDSIRELAEAFFYKKALRAPFMILTAYMDESGTHGTSPVSVMAGYVADARQWRKFEKRTAKLFRRYHVDVCHAIDLKRGDGAFRGWSVDKKLSFIDELGHVKNETIELGLVCVLSNADYQEFYANLPRPRKVIKDSKYGILFRATLGGLMQGIACVSRWQAINKNLRLHVVLEGGHANAADTLRLYAMCRSIFDNRAFAGMALKSKSDCLPLAACDMLAYGAYQVETDGKRVGIAPGPLKSRSSYRGNTQKHRIDKHALNALYLQSIQIHEEKQKFGRRVSREDAA
jgi:hypothetical protein